MSDAVNVTLAKTHNNLSFFKLFQAQSHEHLHSQDGPFPHAACPLIRQRTLEEPLEAALLQVAVSGEVLETTARPTLGDLTFCADSCADA